MVVVHRSVFFGASCTGVYCTFLYFLVLACVSDLVGITREL